jgi:predicted metal-dependent HD superfamily phosphohydrolase
MIWSLLMTAALWHDTGFILTYKDHEEASCQLCKKHLPDFGYSPEEVEIVISLIMDTKLPNNPTNLIESDTFGFRCGISWNFSCTEKIYGSIS